jgi:hypothetical protein
MVDKRDLKVTSAKREKVAGRSVVKVVIEIPQNQIHPSLEMGRGSR